MSIKTQDSFNKLTVLQQNTKKFTALDVPLPRHLRSKLVDCEKYALKVNLRNRTCLILLNCSCSDCLQGRGSTCALLAPTPTLQ